LQIVEDDPHDGDEVGISRADDRLDVGFARDQVA
jgi:hypothetical protein